MGEALRLEGYQAFQTLLEALAESLAFPFTADVVRHSTHPITFEDKSRRTMNAASTRARRVMGLGESDYAWDVWRRLRDDGGGCER